MMKKRLLLSLFLWCFAGVLLAECAITDVKVHQRWPWNGLVDISYNVVCDDMDSQGNPIRLELELSGYDALRNLDIPMTTLSGEGVDVSVPNGGPYKITWNAGVDCPDFASEYFRVKIKAYVSGGESAPTAKVDSVEIAGNSSLDNRGEADFSILVNWSNGTQTVADSKWKIQWSISSGGQYASVDSSTGKVTTNNTSGADQKVVLSAICMYKNTVMSIVRELTVVGPNAYLVVNLEDGSCQYTGSVPDLSNDACRTTELWLKRIPAGTFTMGSPDDEVGRYSNETQHQVKLTQDYYMGIFEITQRQWELLMNNRPSFCSADDYYATRPVECVTYDDVRGAGWPANGNSVTGSTFVGLLQSKTGLTFDLPTEAQWEYACRGGKTTALNSGANLSAEGEDASVDEVGRYWYNGGSSYSMICDPSSGTAKVGSFLPNEFGLYDMHGNVWEWCLDWYSENLGTSSAKDPVGASVGLYRVTRGGSWQFGALNSRAACRGYHLPNCASFFGLRVVCLDLP